jgi:hypothetical protein
MKLQALRMIRCLIDTVSHTRASVSTYVVPLAIGAVAVVLMLGLHNMLRGGSPNLSQTLMRWRVVLQFIAIIIIMLTVWVMQR